MQAIAYCPGRSERILGSVDHGNQHNPILIDNLPRNLHRHKITLTEFAQIKNLQELRVQVDASQFQSMGSDGYVCVTRQFEGDAFEKICWSCEVTLLNKSLLYTYRDDKSGCCIQDHNTYQFYQCTCGRLCLICHLYFWVSWSQISSSPFKMVCSIACIVSLIDEKGYVCVYWLSSLYTMYT